MLIQLYIAVLVFPWTRNLIDIALLSLLDYILIALAVIAWALLLRHSRKARIFERFFGYH